MSFLSDLIKKVVPAKVLGSPVVALGVGMLTPYIEIAKVAGRSAVKSAVTIKVEELLWLAPHANKELLTSERDALTISLTNLIMTLAGTE